MSPTITEYLKIKEEIAHEKKTMQSTQSSEQVDDSEDDNYGTCVFNDDNFSTMVTTEDEISDSFSSMVMTKEDSEEPTDQTPSYLAAIRAMSVDNQPTSKNIPQNTELKEMKSDIANLKIEMNEFKTQITAQLQAHQEFIQQALSDLKQEFLHHPQ